jgi:hypothetical protein
LIVYILYFVWIVGYKVILPQSQNLHKLGTRPSNFWDNGQWPFLITTIESGQTLHLFLNLHNGTIVFFLQQNLQLKHRATPSWSKIKLMNLFKMQTYSVTLRLFISSSSSSTFFFFLYALLFSQKSILRQLFHLRLLLNCGQSLVLNRKLSS